MFGMFFVAAGFGAAVNGVLRTKWGHLLNLSTHRHRVVTIVRPRSAPARARYSSAWHAASEEIPTWCCWASLIAICAICLCC